MLLLTQDEYFRSAVCKHPPRLQKSDSPSPCRHFSAACIRICRCSQVYGPHLHDLTLIDLPGIIVAPLPGVTS